MEDLKELMVLGREPFSEQEFKNFLVALNPTDDGKVYYMDYVALMTGGKVPCFNVPSALPLVWELYLASRIVFGFLKPITP